MSKELSIKDDYELAKPAQMTSMAVVLKSHILKNKLYTSIRDKNYAHVEGWQFAGGLLKLYPRVVSVEDISKGTEVRWKAQVEIVSLKGEVVSRGFAMCSNKETNKRAFDEYAVLSMAQTRAIGKAYRNLIGWIMKLADYESTPSEEMMKVGAEEPQQTQPQGHTGFECHECAIPIQKVVYDYSMRMYGKAYCRQHQKGVKTKTTRR